MFEYVRISHHLKISLAVPLIKGLVPGWAPGQSQNPRSYRHGGRAGCRRSCGKVGRAIISEDPKKTLKQPLDFSRMSRINLKIGIPDLMRNSWTLCIPLYFRSSVAALACSQPVASASETVPRAVIKAKSSQFSKTRK